MTGPANNASSNYDIISFGSDGDMCMTDTLEDVKGTVLELRNNSLYIDNAKMRLSLEYPHPMMRMYEGRMNLGSMQILVVQANEDQTACFVVVEYTRSDDKSKFGYWSGICSWGFVHNDPVWRGISRKTWEKFVAFLYFTSTHNNPQDRVGFLKWADHIRDRDPYKIKTAAIVPYKGQDEPVSTKSADEIINLDIPMPDEGKINKSTPIRTNIDREYDPDTEHFCM